MKLPLPVNLEPRPCSSRLPISVGERQFQSRVLSRLELSAAPRNNMQMQVQMDRMPTQGPGQMNYVPEQWANSCHVDFGSSKESRIGIKRAWAIARRLADWPFRKSRRGKAARCHPKREVLGRLLCNVDFGVNCEVWRYLW
jgi:hypothetical protein